MSSLYERCSCGAEFRVEADQLISARKDVKRWRSSHRHEWPPGDHYSDHVGTHHGTGFQTERDGRIEEVQ